MKRGRNTQKKYIRYSHDQSKRLLYTQVIIMEPSDHQQKSLRREIFRPKKLFGWKIILKNRKKILYFHSAL